MFLSEASPPAPRSQNEPSTHPPGFPTGPTRERSRQRPSRSQRRGTETWGHPGNPSKNGQASKTGSAPRPRIGGLRSYRGTMEFQKKMGPGSGPELGPTTPPTDAVAAREKLVSPSFRAGISGPKTGSNPGPPFFKKQRKRAEKISPATTAVIVAPMLWGVGSTPHAPCSRDQLRRHRARPLPGLAPKIPRGAGGPCEPSPSACRRCQLHAGSVRP